MAKDTRVHVCRKEIASSPFLRTLRREPSLSLWQYAALISRCPPTGSELVDVAAESLGRGHFSLITCYGIGSIASSRISQHQLAVLLELRDWLQVEWHLSFIQYVSPFVTVNAGSSFFQPIQAEVFDPVLTRNEQRALCQLGLEVLSTNEVLSAYAHCHVYTVHSIAGCSCNVQGWWSYGGHVVV